MSKTTRFFEIIQMLRGARGPLRAEELAYGLEVSKRTIYRDVATLQGMGTPIYGEAGIGYVLRKGYDLPPVNFDVEEAEAVRIGLSMIARTGDEALWQAAKRAARKLQEVAPDMDHLIASSWGAAAPDVDPGLIRTAIRDERKLHLHYADEHGAVSNRVIWPLALIYYADRLVLVAHCVLRQDFRHFRLDRMTGVDLLEEHFKGQGVVLRGEWDIKHRAASVDTR